ncbi:hypothetical protein LH991_11670 [Schleiferilactobacillus harbinensis]|uniref:hypothetical protein n=1 Tax=Schleiferilactobacillus harbinensis TaxID=304207 RepID=UPI00048453FF|nr:hypothetical protein [Schleiferilactobacillus harbinensis]QFR64550.1 hypothetical protein LH991_11670 [Schleiferilactobacillus harbinensis]
MELVAKVVFFDLLIIYVGAILLLSGFPLWIRAAGIVIMLFPIYSDAEWLFEHKKMEGLKK